MVDTAAVAVVGLMGLFGVAFAAVATVIVRRIAAQFDPGTDRYGDLALYGAPPYVVAFLVFGVTFATDVDTVFGVDALFVGTGIMLLSAVPWSVAIVGAAEAGVDGPGPG